MGPLKTGEVFLIFFLMMWHCGGSPPLSPSLPRAKHALTEGSKESYTYLHPFLLFTFQPRKRGKTGDSFARFA